MPASMMSAATGGTLKVSGSSIAMVASGPMPGSTPIRVPSSTPMKQNQRFCSVSATVKPKMRLLNSSMSVFPDPLDHRIGQPEAPDEDRQRKDGEADGEQQDFEPLELLARRGRHRYQQQQGGNEPGLLHGHAENDGRNREDDQCAPRKPGLDLLVVLHPHQHHGDAEGDHHAAQDAGEVARPHAQRAAEGIIAGHPHADGTEQDVEETCPEVAVVAPVELHSETPASVETDACERQAGCDTTAPPLLVETTPR